MQQLQILLLSLILVLLLIKAVPKIIEDYRKFKMEQRKPYAYFELTTINNNSLDENKIESDVKFKSYCNQMGLMLFVKQLNDNLISTTKGKVDLIKLLEEVQKAEEEGELIVESADEDS